MPSLAWMLLQAAPTGNPWFQMVPLLLIMLVFYFLMLRPQMQAQKKAKAFREALQKGDRVVTASGIYGRILSLDEKSVLVEIDANVKVRMEREAIRAYVSTPAEGQPA